MDLTPAVERFERRVRSIFVFFFLRFLKVVLGYQICGDVSFIFNQSYHSRKQNEPIRGLYVQELNEAE